ncbi:MAG: glutamate racemase [Candidatus Brocadiaceae bacterium]|nr:glutamate racemase [Candidatus Brocadiaceae bacterium]
MNNSKTKLPIGILDSGIGGISVLAEIIKMLPHNEFVYFSDTLNFPYGTKPEDTVRSLSLKATEFLASIGIKSLVVACNTATSAAINEIRTLFDFPVIGMEPAIKLAVECNGKGKILVMATPLTLNSKNFIRLTSRYTQKTEVVSLPCIGLAEFIERQNRYNYGNQVNEYLIHLFSSIPIKDISTIVLGCTHFVLIKKEIRKIVGDDVVFIDGNYGTARQLKTVLQEKQLLYEINTSPASKKPLKAKITFCVSGNEKEVIKNYKYVLENEGITCE